jgi:hypothetical protein
MIKIYVHNIHLDINNNSEIILDLQNHIRYILLFKFYDNDDNFIIDLDRNNTILKISELSGDKKYELFSCRRDMNYFTYVSQHNHNIKQDDNLWLYDFRPEKYENHKLNLDFTFTQSIQKYDNIKIKIAILELDEFSIDFEKFNEKIEDIFKNKPDKIIKCYHCENNMNFPHYLFCENKCYWCWNCSEFQHIYDNGKIKEGHHPNCKESNQTQL